MKQQLLEQEVRDLKDYIAKLEDEIIQGSRDTALRIIRERRNVPVTTIKRQENLR